MALATARPGLSNALLPLPLLHDALFRSTMMGPLSVQRLQCARLASDYAAG
jgi:hypothetical protein